MEYKTVFKHEQPDDSGGFLLWKVTALWQAKLEVVLDKYDINQLQFVILASLKWFEEHSEETTQAHIAEHAKLNKMVVSRAVRKLEDKGFLSRFSSQVDGRAQGLAFTKHGKNIVEQAIISVEKEDDLFFSILTKEEFQQYKELTKKLIRDVLA